jgi:hypothetical protein
MEQRIQLRGHCQHCGRIQAVNEGGLAKHGYTVEFGWFQGTCSGAHAQPLERSRVELDGLVANLRTWAGDAEDQARQLEQRETDPDGIWESYAEFGQRKRRLRPYAELTEDDKRRCRVARVLNLRRKAEAYRDHAAVLLALAEQVHGQPLVDVKVAAAAKTIQVGDRVKVCGQEVVVTRIGEQAARGVGYRVNGQYMEHVFWLRDGREYGYPKRYARKVQEA